MTHRLALQVSRYWKTLIEYSTTLKYSVLLGIHGKIDQPRSSRLSVAGRLDRLVNSESLGWTRLNFPRQDELLLFQEQIRIMGFGGTCERSGHYATDNADLTLAALPNASSSLPFEFETLKNPHIKKPDYTQDPALDVIIFRAR